EKKNFDTKEKEFRKTLMDMSNEKEERILKLISAVWNHIENLNFPDISKYPTTLAGIVAFEEDLINGAI
ncbi:hypothetical protein EBR37_02375, partial [bacterium]|nr:hypothetical protein [bacterium]